uniref:Kinesin motor domain-containing protein n=1 Tax=Trichuris muris TaxID=70415 RepID=A0A5S6QUT2_TRIMR
MSACEECPVRVAVRIRPQLRREKDDLCRSCISTVANEPQVLLGDDRSFTYDFLFDESQSQCNVYAKCVHDLVERCFDGFNATVLAYGQTGSGKTYTMGTGLDNACGVEQGIIPRAVDQLYNSMEKRANKARGNDQKEPSFLLEAQFIEIYNDEVVDLLDTCQGEEKKRISIHEDKEGNIHLKNVTTVPIGTSDEAMRVLRIGAVNRTTGCTLMNEQSSRSHAMFILRLTINGQNGWQDIHEDTNTNSGSACSNSVLSSKLNFVDLAGSERVKRTGATGRRAKEGISINSGLLALGNVISALGDRSLKVTHVPYRDSKLTRLLQDSLGGNSRTLMIACVGPSDCDFIETLNTLKYANRARNIRNKVVINQQRSSTLVSELQLRLKQLEQELTEFRLGQRSADDFAYENQLYEENLLLANEVKTLNLKVRCLQDMVRSLKSDAVTTSQDGIDNANRSSYELEDRLVTEGNEPSSIEIQKRDYFAEPMTNTTELAEIYGQRDSMTTSSASDSSHPQLTELQNEIMEREREIQRLKASHQRLLTAKSTYEARLQELSSRIRKTEMERDQAMLLMRKSCNPKAENDEKAQDLKKEYEQKLGAMRVELKRLGSLKKENEKLLKEQSKNLSRIAVLQSRLEEVKHARKELLQQIKTSNQEVMAADRHKEKQIRNLQRESLKKDMCIQSLRNEKERAAAILRQKQQEVNALRRRSRSTMDLNRRKPANVAACRDQDLLWREVRAQLHECIAKREACIEVECDYDHLLEKRKSILKSLTKLKEKGQLFDANSVASKHSDPADDEIDSLEANLAYVEKCIQNCEQRIMAVDEDNVVECKLYSLFDSCQSMRRAKALMRKLSSATLLQAHVASGQRKKIGLLNAKMHQLAKEKRVLEQLLVHVVKDSSTHDLPGAREILKVLSNAASVESDSSGSQQLHPSKARQRMTTTAELLYPGSGQEEYTEVLNNDCRTRECSPEPGCSFDVLDSDECFTMNDMIANGTWEGTYSLSDENNANSVARLSLSRCASVKPDGSTVQKVHADGSNFISLSHSGRLMLWDIERLTGFHIPSSDLIDPKDAKLDLSSNRLFVAARHGISIRDTRTWHSTCTLSSLNCTPVSEPSPQIPFVQVDCLCTLPYVFGITNKSLHVWDIRNFHEVASVCTEDCCFGDGFAKAYVVPSGRHEGTVALAGSQFVQLLEPVTSKDCVYLSQSFEFQYPLKGFTKAVATVESLLFAVVNDSLLCWDMSSNARNVCQVHHCSWTGVSCLAPFCPSEVEEHCWLVSADESGKLHSWDTAGMTNLGLVEAHSECINSLSTARERLFTASSDSTIAIWKYAGE